MLNKNFSRQHIEIFFLFYPENRLWHFMQIVSQGDNLHEMSKPIFWEKEGKHHQCVVCSICLDSGKGKFKFVTQRKLGCKNHDLGYGTGPPREFRQVSMCRVSHWSGQQQHLLQWLQALGAQEMQWAQTLEKWPWLQMYTVTGNCTPLGWQTTEGVQVGPDKLEVVASFCYLGDMLSAAGGCELSTTTDGENSLEELQGSATSSLFTPPLFQNTVCTALVCGAQCSMPARLGHWQSRTSSVCRKWQGNDQTDLQCQAARHCHHQVQWATCAAWHWGSGPHSEGEKTPMVWTCGTLQWCSQDRLWHTGW